MPVRIFISYRRDDLGATAGRLRERLVKEFGTNNVFMDVDSIPAGVDFAAHLQRTLEACQLVLALIGPNWLKSVKCFRSSTNRGPVRFRSDGTNSRSLQVDQISASADRWGLNAE